MMQSDKKPNFFIVGAPKCGTTSMYVYLKQHPEIFMTGTKEPYYFGRDLTRINNLYQLSEKEYLNHFSYAKNEKIIGEASTHYLFSTSAPEEIIQFNDQSKILIMLRNPVELIYSQHSQYLFTGKEDQDDFNTALNLEENRKLGKNLPKNIDLIEKLFYKTYINRIPAQIDKYLNIFGKNNVNIILLDEMINFPEKIFKKLLQFLEVDDTFLPDFSVENKNKIPRSKIIRKLNNKISIPLGKIRQLISPKPIGIIKFIERINSKITQRSAMNIQLKKKLTAEFQPVVNRIESIIQKDLSSWNYH